MDISIFSVVGPVMIGPSSSHTAGAVRLGNFVRQMAQEFFDRAEFGLMGSFAKTGKGHGTDRALIAGILGLQPDDERIIYAPELAREAGIEYRFYETEMDEVHENSVIMTLYHGEKTLCEVVGSSIGGGRILIQRINGFPAGFHAEVPTLLIVNQDVKGVVHAVSGILADNQINISIMHLNRKEKGDIACCFIEMDRMPDGKALEAIRALPFIHQALAIDPGSQEEGHHV